MNTNDWAQTFDAYGRMTCAKQATTCTSGTTRVQLTYDALDRARTRAYNGTTTTSTYSGISEQLAKTVAGTTTTTYAFTPGGHPMAQRVGSAQASYHLLDTHSDVVGLVSSAAANQGTTSYDAYGGVLATTGTQGIVGYQGDITDTVTRQVDMGTRWYAPGQGRFTSRDVLFGELGSPMTLNQFAYAGENPITMWDPTGMQQAAGEGGGGGNGCDNACQDAQDFFCATHDCGHTDGNGYSPAPTPPQPAPPITYHREGGDYLDRGSGAPDVDELLGVSGKAEADVNGFFSPDYVTIPLTIMLPLGGVPFAMGPTATITRRGKVYVGVQGGLGGPPGADLAVRGGHISGSRSDREIESFVQGWSGHVSGNLPLIGSPGKAGIGPSLGVTWGHPGDMGWENWAAEGGASGGTLGVSVTVSYSWELFDTSAEW